MKKNGVKIFIILVLALGVTVGAYIFMKSKTEQGGNEPGHQQEENKQKGEVKFLNSKQDGAVITQKYKAYINDKVLDLDVIYTYRIEPLPAGDPSGYARKEIVEGKFNNITLFYQEVKNNSSSQKAAMFDTGKIDKELNANYFKVIRGEDGKDYITIATHIYDISSKEPSFNYLYIINDEFQVIDEIFDEISNCTYKKTPMLMHTKDVGLLVDENIWYTNQWNYNNVRRNYILVKFEGDKIYYLYPNIQLNESGDVGEVEERVYTVKDNKLEYTVLKTYKASSRYGDVC